MSCSFQGKESARRRPDLSLIIALLSAVVVPVFFDLLKVDFSGGQFQIDFSDAATIYFRIDFG